MRAPDFHARDLVIENAFDYVGNLVSPQFEAIGPNGPQAVALMLADGSDRACVDRVEIIGHQDTLFADAGRSRFRDCRVRGSVDFIFGAGSARFEDCEIVSRFRPGKERQGYVAAPSTPATPRGPGVSTDAGCASRRCRTSVALGRAWRPTRIFPTAATATRAWSAPRTFDCWIDAHVGVPAWDPMAYTARDGARVPLLPGAARLYEYRSRGPGAAIEQDRRQLSAAEAAACRAAASARHWQP